MKSAMRSRLATACFVVLLSTTISGADDGGRGGDDHGSASPASDLRSSGQDADGDGDAEGDADQDRARDLVEQGIIHPLREVLERVREASPGEVVDIAFARRGGRWIYGLKVLTPAGKRMELTVDAGSLAILPERR